MALLGDGGGFASIFGYEDDRAREDREQRQLQRKMQEDAARFRRESEAPVKALQANLFRHETGNRIRGLELNFQRQAAEDTARTEALDFRKFADNLTRPTLEKVLRPMPQDFGARPESDIGLRQRDRLDASPDAALAGLQPFRDPASSRGEMLPSTIAAPLARGLEAAMNTRTPQLAPFGPGTYGNPSEQPTWGQVAEQNLLKVPGVESGVQQLPEPLREAARTTAMSVNPLTALMLPLAPEATAFGVLGAGAGAGVGQGIEEAVPGAPSYLSDVGTVIGGAYTGPGGGGRRLASAVDESVQARPGGWASEAGGTRLGHTGFPDEAAAVAEVRIDPLQKMTNWMTEQADALKASRKARKAQVSQLRGRQAGILESVYSDPNLTPQQQMERGLQRLPEAGTAGQAQFTPPPLSEPEAGELFARIRDFPIWQNRKFRALNAQKGLRDLMNGELPGQYELGLLEQVFGSEFVRATAKMQPSAWREIATLAGLPRTIRTILDVSWPLRQGIGALPRHPKEVVGNAPRGAWTVFSEKSAQQWDEATRAKSRVVGLIGDDGAPQTWTIGELQDEAGLYLPRMDEEVAPLAQRSEEFMATQGHDTWVGKVFGPVVRPFSRSFITMGNATRSDIFENVLKGWASSKKGATMEDARGLAWLLNVATGRGDLGQLNRYGALFAQPIFSPRLVAARIEHAMSPALLKTGAFGVPKSDRAAALAAQQLVAFVGSGAAIVTLASMAPGIRSTVSPLSSKWGKLEIGYDANNPLKETTKIDIFGGYQQYARTIAQLYAAKAESDTGEIYPKDRKRILEQFIRNKVSPNVGTVWDLVNMETAVGEKIDLKTAAGIRTFLWNEYSPLSFNDIVEAVNRDDGIQPEYGLLAPLSLGGTGVQTYGGRPQTVLYGMPYYEGIPTESEKDLRKFMDEARYEYQRAKAAGADLSQADVARILGQQTGRAGLGNAAAQAFAGDLPLNKERIQFAIDHQDDLEADVLLGAVPDAILREYLTKENFDRVFKR